MNIDKFLDRTYQIDKYTCGHFVAEVYGDLTGEDVHSILTSFVQGRKFTELLRTRKKIAVPATPCLAVIRAENEVPHVGVHIDGKILHLSDQGARLQSLETFTSRYQVSFYR